MARVRPHRALAEQRPLLVLSALAAMAYYYLRAAPLPDLYLVPLKGLGPALLAAYAWRCHGSQDARLLVIALAIGACGDMAARIDLSAGAVAWFGALCVFIMLFLRHTRERLTPSQKAAAVALLFVTPVIAWSIPDAAGEKQAAGIYGLTLGAMAGAAWTSTFPRYRVGAGAVLLLTAHLLTLAELGPLAQSLPARIFPWPLGFLGLLLIALGVTQTLRKHDPELRIVVSN